MKQTEMWERPRNQDPTPLETGGALVILRLSPVEVESLAHLAPTLDEAIHLVIKEWADSRIRLPAPSVTENGYPHNK